MVMTCLAFIALFVMVACGQQPAETYSLSFHLDKAEQYAYEGLKQKLDESLLKDLEPIGIAKIYVLASFEREDDVSYFLYTQREGMVAWTKEEDAEIPEKDRGNQEQIAAIYNNLENGEFVETSDFAGYIAFEPRAGEKSGFQMIKDETDIWKVAFMPIQ